MYFVGRSGIWFDRGIAGYNLSLPRCLLRVGSTGCTERVIRNCLVHGVNVAVSQDALRAVF